MSARDLELARREHDDASRATAEAQADHDAALAVQADAERVYDASGADADLDTVLRVKARTERAARVLAARVAAEADAKARVDAAERACLADRYTAACSALTDRARRFARIARRVAELDRELHSVVMTAASETIDFADARADVRAMAAQLGELLHFDAEHPARSLGDTQALARVAIADARDREGREDVSGWLVAAERPRWTEDSDRFDAALAALREVTK